MQPDPNSYQELLSSIIKKQIIIFGPDITLKKARNVEGLQVKDDGTVTLLSNNPHEAGHKLLEQFMGLSSLIVKKTMEPLLSALGTSETENAIDAVKS